MLPNASKTLRATETKLAMSIINIPRAILCTVLKPRSKTLEYPPFEDKKQIEETG